MAAHVPQRRTTGSLCGSSAWSKSHHNEAIPAYQRSSSSAAPRHTANGAAGVKACGVSRPVGQRAQERHSGGYSNRQSVTEVTAEKCLPPAGPQGTICLLRRAGLGAEVSPSLVTAGKRRRTVVQSYDEATRRRAEGAKRRRPGEARTLYIANARGSGHGPLAQRIQVGPAMVRRIEESARRASDRRRIERTGDG